MKLGSWETINWVKVLTLVVWLSIIMWFGSCTGVGLAYYFWG